ncbi:MAG: hypothetical protein ACKOKE_04425 [Actinomycetota bacterium]
MLQRVLRAIGAIGIGTGALLALGIAYAAWTATGSGSGASEATTALALSTVDATALTSAQLYPGGTGDLTVKIHNPNPFGVTVRSIQPNGAITSDRGAACTASTGLSFTGRTGLTEAIPANGTVTVTLAGAVSMDGSSDDTCQGATFTVPVTLG